MTGHNDYVEVADSDRKNHVARKGAESEALCGADNLTGEHKHFLWIGRIWCKECRNVVSEEWDTQ